MAKPNPQADANDITWGFSRANIIACAALGLTVLALPGF